VPCAILTFFAVVGPSPWRAGPALPTIALASLARKARGRKPRGRPPVPGGENNPGWLQRDSGRGEHPGRAHQGPPRGGAWAGAGRSCCPGRGPELTCTNSSKPAASLTGTPGRWPCQ